MKYWLTLLLLIAALGAGVCVEVMDNDAAHHISIAQQMMETGNYTTLYDVVNDEPFLDKPHLQMWLIALSFNWLGVSGLVYKLSSLLFVLLTLISVYKLAERLSLSRKMGMMAVLILLSMMAFMLGSSVDIRMDAILTGSVAFAVWQGVVAVSGTKKFRFMPHLGLALGLALAFSTKGFYGVVVAALALLFYLIGTRTVRWLFSWKFLVSLLLFGVLILPVLYSYYLQYDWVGVRFILFDQVFARSGGNYGVASADDPLFFFHTLLWAIVPWSGVFYFFVVRSLVRRKVNTTYWLTIPATLLIMVMFSFSTFKLPHYLNPLFVLMALFVADCMQRLEPRTKLLKGVGVVQKVMVGLCVVVSAVVNYWVFPFEAVWLGALYGVGLLWLVATLFTPYDRAQRIVLLSCAASGVLWLGLNLNFYPQLMRYQASDELAATCLERGITPKQVGLYRANGYSILSNRPIAFDLYHKGVHRWVKREELIDSTVRTTREPYLVVSKQNYLKLLQDSVIVARSPKVEAVYTDYRITRLTSTFLNPNTRRSTLDTLYLVQWQKPLYE